MVKVKAFSWAIALSGLVGCAAPTNPVGRTLDARSVTQAATSTPSDRPLVVVSHPVLCDLTRRIAGDSIDLKCLIDAGSDPHEYKTKPGEVKAIEQAKLILYGGYNFEPGLIKSIQASGNTAIVAVDELAVPKPIQITEKTTSEPDPHVWHDAQNGRRMIQTIADKLSQLTPAQANLYRANSKVLDDELIAIDTWIKAQIATIPVAQRKLVTTHDALNYYGRAYGLPIEGALQGLSTDEQPTPSRVAELVTVIKNAKVPTIFAESTGSGTLIQTVATEAGVKVADRPLIADGLGESGSVADSYAKMLVANTQTIVEGLGGQVTPIQLKP
jgi:manganese/iron transport system substrate-binding protein